MLRNFQQFVEAIFLAESKFAKNVEASLMRELEIVDEQWLANVLLRHDALHRVNLWGRGRRASEGAVSEKLSHA